MLMTVKDFAKREKRSEEAIRKRIQRGRLPAVKLGRDWLIDSEVTFKDRRNLKDKITVEIIHEPSV